MIELPSSAARLNWRAPDTWTTVETIDMHTEGEPLRVYLFPQLNGDTILARRRDAKARFDQIRTALMWEPRGHADMYGCILTEPEHKGGDVGVIFTHNEGYSTMCGHGIIAVTKLVLEAGLLPDRKAENGATTVRIDTPAGRVTARGWWDGDRITRVSFHNVPAFVALQDATVTVPEVGEVTFDLAFGGAYYAYVQAKPLGLRCNPDNYRNLIDLGRRIKHAVMEQHPITHPGDPDLAFLYGTIFIEPGDDPVHSRNVCIFADGEVDRCPTGTGVSGRAAIHHARGELPIKEWITIQSIIGSSFRVRAAQTTKVGDRDAVIPEVEGRAWITGRHQFLIDPSDPLKDGFFLR